MNLLNIILTIVGIFLIRFVLNFQKYLFLRKAETNYDTFVRSTFDDADENLVSKGKISADWITENQIEIKKLILKCGLQDPKETLMKPIGLNYATSTSVSTLDNLLYVNEKIMEWGRDLIKKAKGYYRRQAYLSLNPIFWIESLLFLPRVIINYLNIEKENKTKPSVINIFQILYWLGYLIFAYLNLIKK